MTATTNGHDTEALCEVIRQSERSLASRRVALLHIDRLPHALSKPHHVRLARQALESLAGADRAQSFELSRGRVAILWRGSGGSEIGRTREALGHLLAGQKEGGAPALGELLTIYDLPRDAAWLLDEMAESVRPERPAGGGAKLDMKLLMSLEASLAQADLSGFARWRSVMALPPATRPSRELGHGAHVAWEERYFAMHQLAAGLCPERHLRGDPWLFHRLTRTLDTRLLAMLSALLEMRGSGTFAINLNMATILSPEFLRFDDALPLLLRGEVILNLRAADILSDPATFAFMRNFTRARGYRLALAGASQGLLRFFDVAAAGLDYVQIKLTPELRDECFSIERLAEAGVSLVLTGLDRPSDLRWAAERGFRLGRGRVFSP